MGLCSTALLVAVIARKLEQTHNERYVYNFLSRVHLRNRYKAAAADVVKYTIKICILRRRNALPVSAMDRTVLQWRLRSAIRTIRASRVAEAQIEQASVGLTDVCQMMSMLDRRVRDCQNSQTKLLDKMDQLQDHMAQALGSQQRDAEGRGRADSGKT